MENKIKKVFIALNDENKVCGFVSIYEDTLKKHGFEHFERESFLNEYNEMIEELSRGYEEEFKDLSLKAKVQKLIELGKIEVKKNRFITQIKVFEGYEKAIIVYSNGDSDIITSKEFSDQDAFEEHIASKIEELFYQYGLDYSSDEKYNDWGQELIANGFLEEKVALEETNSKKTFKDVLKESKVYNFVLNHRLLSAIVAGAVLLTSGIAIGSLTAKKGGSSTSPQVIEEETKEDTVTAFDDVEVEEVSYIEDQVEDQEIMSIDPIAPVPEYIGVPQPKIRFKDRYEDADVIVRELSVNGYENVHRYTDTDFDFRLSSLLEMRGKNMSVLASFYQSPQQNSYDNTIGYEIYFEKLVTDSKDKAFVEYFSKFGNEIISSAYRDRNINDPYGATFYSVWSSYEMIRCIRDGYPIKANIDGQEQYVFYQELSDKAKEIVLNLAWTNYFMVNTSTINYEGESFIQDDIGSMIIRENEELSRSK